jgi:hypothetical protein
MKKIIVFLVLFAVVLSCSVQKRKYSSGYFVQKVWKKHPGKETPGILVKKTKGNRPVSASGPQVSSYQAYTETAGFASAQPFHQEGLILTHKQPLAAPMDSCDVLILKSGEEIAAKILEITDDAIKYKKCDNPLGPTYSMAKERVFMIKYINGTKELVTAPERTGSGSSQKSPADKAPGPRKVQGLALWGFIIALVGWFVPAVALALVMELAGIAFGISGLVKIDKSPEKYKGKGFAITAIILGILGIIIIAALMV